MGLLELLACPKCTDAACDSMRAAWCAAAASAGTQSSTAFRLCSTIPSGRGSSTRASSGTPRLFPLERAHRPPLADRCPSCPGLWRGPSAPRRSLHHPDGSDLRSVAGRRRRRPCVAVQKRCAGFRVRRRRHGTSAASHAGSRRDVSRPEARGLRVRGLELPRRTSRVSASLLQRDGARVQETFRRFTEIERGVGSLHGSAFALRSVIGTYLQVFHPRISSICRDSRNAAIRSPVRVRSTRSRRS